MFERLKKFINEVMRMFTTNEYKKILGNTELSSTMIEAIELWNSMIIGKADWTSDSVPSLGIEGGICRELADIAINEMTAEVDNDELAEKFKQITKDLNENLQDGLALGSFIIKPFLDGSYEYVSANNIVPIEFTKTGKLKDVALIQRKRKNDTTFFYRIERHTLTEMGLQIKNEAYAGTATTFDRPIELTAVEEWANLPQEIIYPGMDKMDFGYYRNPQKNRVDGTACGVSVYSNAVDLIRNADIQGARVDWEYESGERAIHVDERALKRNGNNVSMPKLNRRLYRGLNLDQRDGELLKEYSPTMRDDAYRAGLESYLRRIEFNVGLAYGDLSNAQYVEKTATEIRTAKQRKYNRVTAIQDNLQECLEDLVDAIAFYSAKYTTSYTLTCSFKDSILTDEVAERQQDMADVSMGAMSLAEYRAKWYGETLEQAEKNLPEVGGTVIDMKLE